MSLLARSTSSQVQGFRVYVFVGLRVCGVLVSGDCASPDAKKGLRAVGFTGFRGFGGLVFRV